MARAETETLEAFSQRLHRAIEGLLVVNDVGLHTVEEYDANAMWPRYSFPEHNIPLSIFRGEGEALFLVVRAMRPKLVAEFFTGTGYSAPWMAAAWPQAEVWSVDNYSEGDAGDRDGDEARGQTDERAPEAPPAQGTEPPAVRR